MAIRLSHIQYGDLNARQRERYNFQKIAGILADYGFSSIKLDDDWQSADFIAQHIDGSTFIKVQLKARLTFDRKYLKKDIYIAFPYKNGWYLIEHDKLLDKFLKTFPDKMAISLSWAQRGEYSWSTLSKAHLKMLEPYKLVPFNTVAVSVEE